MRVNKLHVKHDQPELDGASHSVYESRPKEAQADFEDDGIGADFVCGFNQFLGLLLVKAAVFTSPPTQRNLPPAQPCWSMEDGLPRNRRNQSSCPRI